MMEFWVNPDINMTEIKDSMQMDSYIEIAHLTANGRMATIETRGYVHVVYNDVDYRTPSEFPKELRQMFADGTAYNNPDVEILENNWFELFLCDGDRWITSDVVDCEGCTPDELKGIMMDAIENW